MSDETKPEAPQAPEGTGRPVKQPCCEAWAKAHEWGTDNEGHSALVHYLPADQEGAKAYFGIGQPPVHRCPWCATKKA